MTTEKLKAKRNQRKTVNSAPYPEFKAIDFLLMVFRSENTPFGNDRGTKETAEIKKNKAAQTIIEGKNNIHFQRQ